LIFFHNLLTVRCGVERFIDGPYHKHNNNYGFVSEDDRNTPQAFSHFTYEASNHSVLICDIQGVGDMYTDPQVHTRDGIGFGKGNLGMKGFEKFLSTHRCNAICKYFRLPSVNEKEEDSGTVPQANLATVKTYPRIIK
jgi:elongation factor 2 kinase